MIWGYPGRDLRCTTICLWWSIPNAQPSFANHYPSPAIRATPQRTWHGSSAFISTSLRLRPCWATVDGLSPVCSQEIIGHLWVRQSTGFTIIKHSWVIMNWWWTQPVSLMINIVDHQFFHSWVTIDDQTDQSIISLTFSSVCRYNMVTDDSRWITTNNHCPCWLVVVTLW